MTADIHYSKDYERAVLGACLLQPDGFSKLYNNLHAEIFYWEGHQFVFMSLQEMFQQNIPIDLLTAYDYIVRVKQTRFINNWNVGYYLTRLTDHVVNDHHLPYHSQILKKMWAQRELLKITTTPVQAGDYESAITQIERRIQTIKPLITNRRTLPFKILRFLVNYIDKPLIRDTIHLYGNKYIAGTNKHCLKVDSPLLVYLMHLIDPRYTYSCQGAYDEYLNTEKCKSFIPAGAVLSDQSGTRVWIDRKYRYPKSFDL